MTQPSQGGGVTISTTSPSQGDTVTPRPDEGYELGKITVTGPDGKPVEIRENADGTFSFTQPAGKVTIEVEYQPIPPVELPWSSPFIDVVEGDWHYDAVRFVLERGLFYGTSPTAFRPNGAMTRGMLTTVLYRAAGEPSIEDEIWGYPFADVDAAAYYGMAVYWARLNGIAHGYSGETFGPDDPIIREQLTVMLWRYAGSPSAANGALPFRDADEISGYALDAMRWAMERGILNGYSNGRLNPQGQATRAEAAQILKNFFENQEENT